MKKTDDIFDEKLDKKAKKKLKKDIKLKKKEKRKKRKKFILFILLILIILVTYLSISILKWQNIFKVMLDNEHSIILDQDGNIIANLGDEKIHKNISFSEMPDSLKNAYVSIEDERFYKHHGVDTKRTIAAIGSYIIHFGSSSFGGSTITQQLVKNLTGDSSNSINRKTTEWIEAFALESCTSKNEILETYLNIIYLGPNIYGVEKASEYYFNKSAKDLSLEESAFIAGLTHSPNSYNPFTEKDNEEKIKSRTKTVLYKMLDLKYISQEEYDNAVSAVESGLNFDKGNVQADGSSIYSYHTDAVISELVSTISKKETYS